MIIKNETIEYVTITPDHQFPFTDDLNQLHHIIKINVHTFLFDRTSFITVQTINGTCQHNIFIHDGAIAIMDESSL